MTTGLATTCKAMPAARTAASARAAEAISRYSGYSALTAWLVEPTRGERRAVFARDRGTDVYLGLRIPTGAGRHEIVLADDGRLAYVTNRDARTLSVIDAVPALSQTT